MKHPRLFSRFKDKYYRRFHSSPELSRYTFKSRKVIWPPSPKSILVALNLSADRVIESIENARFDYSASRLSLFDCATISEVEWSVLLLEDRRFFIHSGADGVRAALRVAKQLLTLQRVGGISTVEQQLVRTILDDRRRNIARKIRETIVANAISYRKRKIDTLRTYLRHAYMGYRIKGVDQAALVVFKKRESDCSREEADFLASLLVYPIPKILIQNLHVVFPNANAKAILETANKYAPWWTSRMRRRTSYAAHLRRYTIKPLYEVH